MICREDNGRALVILSNFVTEPFATLEVPRNQGLRLKPQGDGVSRCENDW